MAGVNEGNGYFHCLYTLRNLDLHVAFKTNSCTLGLSLARMVEATRTFIVYAQFVIASCIQISNLSFPSGMDSGRGGWGLQRIIRTV